MQAEPQKVVAVQLDGTAPRVVILFEGGDQEAIEGLHWSTDAPQGKVRLLARRLADCGFPWLIGEIVAHLRALPAGFSGNLLCPEVNSWADPLPD